MSILKLKIICSFILIITHHLVGFYGYSPQVHAPSIMVLLQSNVLSGLLSLLILLRVTIYLDEVVLQKRQENGVLVKIHEDELSLFNQAECIETPLSPSHAFSQIAPQYVQYSDLSEIDDQVIASLAGLPQEFQQHCEIDHSILEGSQMISLDTHCLMSDFPHLPLIQDREQWGLIAKTKIAKNSLLPWVGDLGVILIDQHPTLNQTEQMNRRRLYQNDHWEVFQGGGELQRSNPALLANFFWCQTPSMATTRSPFMIYPPHFLGIPNCVYVTCQSEHGIHSGLLSWREIQAGEQILMYTGSGATLINLYIRLALIQGTKLIYPAILLLVCLKIYFFIW